MNSIGLSPTEMTNLMVALKTELSKDHEPQVQENINHFVEKGYSEENAKVWAGIVASHSIDVSAIIGVIAANNKRILSDLKDAGFINRSE